MRRPLTQMERVVWSMSEYFQSIGMATIRVRGAFVIGAFHAALAQLRVRHPMLALRVGEPHRFGAYWLSADVPEFPVRIISGCTEEQWQSVAEEEMQHPFPFATGPLMRFAVLHAAEFFDVVITFNHLVIDGHSVIYLIRELVEQLGTPTAGAAPLAPLTLPPPMEQLLPPRRESVALARRTPKLKPGRGPAALDKSGRLALLSWSLSEAETAALCARTRAEQTTVYAAISVAYMRACAELDQSSTVRSIETPVDVRARLSPPVGETFGTYVSMIQTHTDCAPARPFWDVARAFKQELNLQIGSEALFVGWRQMERFGAWLPSGLMSWMLRVLLFPFKITYDLSITNVGRLDIPSSYGPLRLESILGMTVQPATPNHRVLSTLMFAGRLRFTFTTRDQALAQELRKRAEHHLAQALA